MRPIPKLTVACLGALLLRPLPAQHDGNDAGKGKATVTPAELAQQLSDPERRRAAAVTLLRLGGPAAQAIADLLVDPALPMAGEGLLAREIAVEVLYHLGPAALPAVDALLDCMKRKELQSLRPRMLQAIGHCVPWHPDRVAATNDALGEMMMQQDARLRVWDVMSRLQFDPTRGTEALLAGLSHENAYVRQLAAEALELVARQRPDASTRQSIVAGLDAALADEPPPIFRLQVKWKNGAGGFAARPDNRTALTTALARALLAVDPALPQTAPGHADLLTHLDPRVRQEAARALGMLGAAAGETTDALVRALDDPEPAVARETASALGLIGKRDESVREGLARAAASADPQLAASAKAALRQLYPPR
jgi:HEAT repeat protein